jgi:hypothetical protein
MLMFCCYSFVTVTISIESPELFIPQECVMDDMANRQTARQADVRARPIDN